MISLKIRLLGCFFLLCATVASAKGFIGVSDGCLIKDGKPYKYVGVNYWYGPLLGLSQEGKERLSHELKFMKRHGITNLRVMVGAEGISKNPSHLPFALQTAQGKYDEELLRSLDYFIAQLGKYDMEAVLYFSNNWEWSGGFAQYLCWNKDVQYPYPTEKGWDAFQAFVANFYDCDSCVSAYMRHCKFIVNRKNSVNGIEYKNDPAIMAWELANEPRPNRDFAKVSYKKWVGEMSDYIKSLDANHLLTLGTEGYQGTQQDIQLWKEIHEFPNVDYATIHVWAKNWGWIDFSNLDKTFPSTLVNLKNYVEQHASIADAINKPLVIEEIGFPRDGHSFDPKSPVTLRNQYFDTLLQLYCNKYKSLQGLNIWAFGGEGRAARPDYAWKKGDAFTGDPAQEEQGLNTLFDTDSSTFKLLQKHMKRMNQ